MRRRGMGFAGGWALALVLAGAAAAGEAPREAGAAFDRYAAGVEDRLARQHGAASGFLAATGKGADSGRLALQNGEIATGELTPRGGERVAGGVIHHWRATAFAPGASAGEFERVMRDFGGYARTFAPEVIRAQAEPPAGDGHERMTMRVRQRYAITVVLDSEYGVEFGALDATHRYSVSRSTRVEEIDAAGTAKERVLSGGEEHGFLWRQNTYWSCEERDGGVWLQVESVSLTRAIPNGLGWLVQPFVESIPRKSLEFVLHGVRAALEQHKEEAWR